MRAGRLDRRLTIQTFTTTQDVNSGEMVKSWATFASVMGGKREMTAKERFAAQQDVSERTCLWTIRWLDGVTAKMRILDDRGELWDIEAVPEGYGRARTMELPCKRVTEADS